MKLSLLAGTAVVGLFAAATAHAQTWIPNTGWYGAVDVGYNWPDKITLDNALIPGGHVTVEQEGNVTGFGRLGYQFTPHWRVEAEVGYHGGDFKSIRGPVALTQAAGSMPVTTVMGNLIYDFAPASTFNPFIGFGVGGGFADISLTAAGQTVNGATPSFGIKNNDSVFAYQGLAGIAWRATQQLSVDFTYRYTDLSDVKYHLISNTGATADLKGGQSSNSISVGLRYAFSAPPPTPKPMKGLKVLAGAKS